MPPIPQAVFSLRVFVSFCTLHGLTVSEGLSSTALDKAWTQATTWCSWFSSHKSCENWFSSQSAITFAFFNEKNLRPEGLRIAVGAFGLSPLIRVSQEARLPEAWPQSCFCFPPLNCSLLGHCVDCLGHPIKGRFTFWIPGFVPQLLQPPLELQGMI